MYICQFTFSLFKLQVVMTIHTMLMLNNAVMVNFMSQCG